MLLVVAFLVLPYAGVFAPSIGKVVYGRSNALWAENYERATRRAGRKSRRAARAKAAGLVPGAYDDDDDEDDDEPEPPPPPVKAVEKEGGQPIGRQESFAKKSARKAQETAIKAARMVKRAESFAKKTNAKVAEVKTKVLTSCDCFNRCLAAAGLDGYTQLVDEYDEETGELKKPVYDTSKWHGKLMDVSWSLRQKVRYWMLEAPIVWDAITYPLYNASSRNRMVSLLKWDMYCFAATFFLWILMYYLTMRTKAAQIALETGKPVGEFEVLWLFLTNWDSWQCQITYGVMKVFFALSSAPFFLFTIGGLNKLFTHTEACAYTNKRDIVPIDTQVERGGVV